MSRRTFSILSATALVLVFTALIIGGCTGSSVPASSGEIKKFSSPEEIRDYLKNSSQFVQVGYNTADGWAGTGQVRTMVPTAAPAPAMEQSVSKGVSVQNSLPSAGGIGSPDHSQTNVQVAGVDEPDFVKNDGRYIYVISGTMLTIVDAYPASSASIVSKTILEDSPDEIFVNGDRLVLITHGFSDDLSDRVMKKGENEAAYMRYQYSPSTPTTHAIFYDIADRARPKILKDFSIDGSYITARMTGTTMYLLSRESVYPYNDRIIIPAVRENSKIVRTPDVYYFDNPEPRYEFTTITSFDVNGGATKDAKTYLAGTDNIVYVSPDAMYVSYQRNNYQYRTMRTGSEPVSPVGISGGGTAGVSPATAPDFNTLAEPDKQKLIQSIKAGEPEAIWIREVDQTVTVIHKIGISDGTITWLAKGEVPGVLKNQFAMDEYAGNLRLATTSNIYTNRGSYEYNSVFVLDSSMKTIGSLTHIAEQEKIYSTRFIGNRLYMVTFKRIDPFFVIDLSTPSAPKILGKLKIPGYSDYVHPYDSTHIIGIGKETGTNDWGGVSTRGIKLALFDVADVEHPKQLDKVEIGDPGSDSAALSDHRAFLFDKEKNLLVIPAKVVRQGDSTDKYNGAQPLSWYGAYVFGVTPGSGFILKGTVEHGTGTTGYYWYGNSPFEVRRSLYIGDTLYTISQKQILANSLDQINTTLATISLPGAGDVLYPVMTGTR